MHILNPLAHDQEQPHWFQWCSTAQRTSAVDSWPPEQLSQRKGSRKFYHPDFTGGRLKHKEAKEGQERCKWYVQGHPGRLLQSECMNPHFSLHPVPLLSAHKVSTPGAVAEFLWVSATVHGGHPEEPTSSQVQKGPNQFAALESIQQRKDQCINECSHPAP